MRSQISSIKTSKVYNEIHSTQYYLEMLRNSFVKKMRESWVKAYSVKLYFYFLNSYHVAILALQLKNKEFSEALRIFLFYGRSFKKNQF